jgi:hypothetical protein
MKNDNLHSQVEIWAPIPGWDGYEVSSEGQVRSWRHQTGRLLRPHILSVSKKRNGYLGVTLYIQPRMRYPLIHQLVLEAFVGPCPPGQEARHVDDSDRSNNSLRNLCWGTRKENAQDRDRHGHTPRGEQHHQGKLTEGQVLFIRSELERGRSAYSLAYQFSVSNNMLSFIKHRKQWSHI